MLGVKTHNFEAKIAEFMPELSLNLGDGRGEAAAA